jgi:peptidoglycan hydrolase-like protein with peptidoglycan-binding domain
MTVRRRAVVWSGVAGVALVGCVVTALMLAGLPGAASAGADDDEPRDDDRSTSTVDRGTLTGTTTKPGTLSRLDGPTIGGAAQGTITWLLQVGDVLAPRNELYRVDDRPVTAFEGALPQWRAFESGMSPGPDVQQVEQNLHDWGYFTRTPDQTFDARTTAAIRAWQKAGGQLRTGTIELGALQFVSGSFVVGGLSAAVGDASGGGPLYTTERTEKVVTVDLPVGSPLATIGGVVSMELPSGTTAPGHVTAVGAAKVDDDTAKTAVPTTLSFDDPAAPGDLTDASVTVDFVSEVREDVLSVPVLALGAAVGGGFVLEVVQPDGTTEAVPVETGLFAGDRVEVTGDVAEGLEVVVPA